MSSREAEGSTGGPCVGIDIGGTKIAAAVVASTGTVLARGSVTTPRTGAIDVLAAAAGLVREVTGGSAPCALGVGSPGVIDPASGTVWSASAVLPGWAGAQVVSELERRCHCPVGVDNDVRMMALGEATHGAGRGYADALYVSVGTGVGGAIWRAGRVWRGPHSTAGEIAHLLVPVDGAIPCGCGRRDHVESAASGPAIEAAYAVRTGCRRDLREIAARIEGGDSAAAGVVEQAAGVLGRALAGFVSAIDVEAVIVGGGVSLIGDSFLAPLRRALSGEVLAPLQGISVCHAELGADAPLIGAAMFAFELIDRSPVSAGAG